MVHASEQGIVLALALPLNRSNQRRAEVRVPMTSGSSSDPGSR
jgi:hypothetical protein